MKRSDADALDDIAHAIDAIRAHLQHGPLSIEIVLDAVAMRLLEIGETVNGLDVGLTAAEPDIPWKAIAGMRDFLAHHYSRPAPTLFKQ